MAQFNKLLDFSQPLDVALLDQVCHAVQCGRPSTAVSGLYALSVLTLGRCYDWQVVMAMYTSRDDNERKQINAFMTAFQQHPQAWSRVDTILEQTKCDQSKFFVSSCVSSFRHRTCLCC